MNKLVQIVKTQKPLIGMVHFAPLIGYPEHPGFDYIAKKMLTEAKILEKTGFDGIIIENNYDTPHTEKIPSMSAAMFASLAKLLQDSIKIPFGLDVLWNDFETSLAICASTNAKFFRVPAFVDTVKTSYGTMPARAEEIISLRKKLRLENIGIFADIQVKHSEMADKKKPLEKSAKEVMDAGADAVILTGKWTGDAPKTNALETVRNVAGNFPVLVGSGATEDNLPLLSKYTDGIIVGTALKKGGRNPNEVNVKPFKTRISHKKALLFAKKFREVYSQGDD